MADQQLASVVVDYSPPTRTTDGKLEFRVWATAQYGRGHPAEGVAVQIYINNRLICTLKSRPDGRTEDYEHTSDVPATSVNLEAWPEGDASRRSTKMPRVDVRPAKPASVTHFKRIDPKKSGYLLAVLLVLDENGNPVQGEGVHVKDPEDERFVYPLIEEAKRGEEAKPLMTDKSGMIRFSIPMDPERDITAIVRGLEEEINTAEY